MELKIQISHLESIKGRVGPHVLISRSNLGCGTRPLVRKTSSRSFARTGAILAALRKSSALVSFTLAMSKNGYILSFY